MVIYLEVIGFVYAKVNANALILIFTHQSYDVILGLPTLLQLFLSLGKVDAYE